MDNIIFAIIENHSIANILFNHTQSYTVNPIQQYTVVQIVLNYFRICTKLFSTLLDNTILDSIILVSILLDSIILYTSSVVRLELVNPNTIITIQVY